MLVVMIILRDSVFSVKTYYTLTLYIECYLFYLKEFHMFRKPYIITSGLM